MKRHLFTLIVYSLSCLVLAQQPIRPNGTRQEASTSIAKWSDPLLASCSPRDEAVDLSYDNASLYAKIPSLTTRKVVALGESLPYNECFAQSAIQILKYRIQHANCKLVALELPLEAALMIDRFAIGDNTFNRKAISRRFWLSGLSDSFLDFFAWLRTYNEKQVRKVRVVGIDVAEDEFLGYDIDLHRYFTALNKDSANDSIRKFVKTFLGGAPMTNGLFGRLLEIPEFRLRNDPSTLKLIEHNLKDLVKYRDEALKEKRDSIMYSNLRFATDLFCDASETVTLYGRLTHTSYTPLVGSSAIQQETCGKLLRRDFGDDYRNIGLLAGTGSVLSLPALDKSVDMRGKVDYITQGISAPPRSLEALLQKVGKAYFYMPTASLPQSFSRMGLKGGMADTLTIEKNVGDIMDGALYIEEARPLKVIRADIPVWQKRDEYIREKDTIIPWE
ncbi:MAG: erythromycin esterase family protein [Mediterranea sp.]|jgi:erythromycin esterase-like protein|nr:erythromycin esterase family protein [Mediterranea sp.]